METMTIKGVYEQCSANGWLGTERARIYLNNAIHIIVGVALEGGGILTQCPDDQDDHTCDTRWRHPELEVEWIGNQPKKKMLYAYWAFVGGNRQILLAEKKGSNVDCLEWLPEDKYPPFEIE